MQEISKNIFEVAAEFAAIEELLNESGGEITPEILALLTISKDQLELKTGGYLALIRKYNADNLIIDSEIERLSGLKRVRDNKVKALKSRLEEAMRLYEIKKVATATGSVTLCETKSVEIDNEANLPAQYLTQKLIITPDKTAIKKAIEGGEKIEGASIVQKPYLRIS